MIMWTTVTDGITIIIRHVRARGFSCEKKGSYFFFLKTKNATWNASLNTIKPCWVARTHARTHAHKYPVAAVRPSCESRAAASCGHVGLQNTTPFDETTDWEKRSEARDSDEKRDRERWIENTDSVSSNASSSRAQIATVFGKDHRRRRGDRCKAFRLVNISREILHMAEERINWLIITSMTTTTPPRVNGISTRTSHFAQVLTWRLRSHTYMHVLNRLRECMCSTRLNTFTTHHPVAAEYDDLRRVVSSNLFSLFALPFFSLRYVTRLTPAVTRSYKYSRVLLILCCYCLVTSLLRAV